MPSDPIDVIHRRLDQVDRAIGEIRDAVRAIADSVAKIVVLEERHAQTASALERTFAALEKIEGRIRTIEIDLPGLREARKWALGTILGATGAVLSAVVMLVLKR